MRTFPSKTRRRSPERRRLVAIALLVGAALAARASAEETADEPAEAAAAELPGEAPVQTAPSVTAQSPQDAAPADTLTAREIYARVLDNRFDASVQELALVSGDRVGREQKSRLQMLWKRYVEGTEEERDGTQSRTLVRYQEPADIRGTGYLVINKRDAANDQFVYLPSLRRVRRVSLRSETIAGTDLSVEDIVPRELDDAEYARIPDELVEGTPCYVVEATPTPDADSGYSRFWLYVEKEHYVPLRVRYWDRGDVEIKELRSPVESIREFEGIWVPVDSTMRHVLDRTYTTITVDLLVPNPHLSEKFFTQRQLIATKLRLPKSVMKGAQKP